MPHLVATLLPSHRPDTNVFEFAVACEVFGLEREEIAVAWYDHRLVSETGTVTLQGGAVLHTTDRLEVLDRADTVIVPCRQDASDAVLDALRAAHERGARMVSFCSGVFALADAGILDGRPAATHWILVDELRRRRPSVQVDGDVLYVDDGQVLTSAGTSAAIDLALHLVRLDHGAEVANQVARRMVVPPHRDGGQAQYARQPVARTDDGHALGPVLDWMLDHLDEPVTVPQLARLAAMSPRTFARHFHALTGTTPLRWLHHQRVTAAQELLEVTDLPVDVVAARVGFGTAANLREHFRRVTGTSPATYRQKFRRLPA